MNSRITEFLPATWFQPGEGSQERGQRAWRDALKKVSQPVGEFVSQHPAAALAIAFAAGVTIAWWLKRR